MNFFTSGVGYLPLKRLLDIVGSLIGLTLFSPLFLFIALKVRHYLGSPVIFTQMRPGLNEIPFKNYKFRSMKNVDKTNQTNLSDEERLTPFGKKLRSSSLDELPELWNVLKGDMSLVGPRPLLVNFLPLFSDEEAKRHSVRPGITGWAQVNGRNAITWEDRLYYDLEYVEKMSLWLDIKIIWLTIKAVLSHKNINSGNTETIIPPPTKIKRPHLLPASDNKKYSGEHI